MTGGEVFTGFQPRGAELHGHFLMANIFLISDTHFGHANTFLKFKQKDGTPMRPFSSVQEMDDYMVEKWNSIVRPKDKVYHLGDVAMHKDSIAVVGRCNGHKRLIRGNHDDHDIKLYLPYFDEIYGSRVLDRMILTHIPLHPESLYGFIGNVHGHVHNNVPQRHFGNKHYNVSVEMVDYTPVPLEEVKQRLLAQQN